MKKTFVALFALCFGMVAYGQVVVTGGTYYYPQTVVTTPVTTSQVVYTQPVVTTPVVTTPVVTQTIITTPVANPIVYPTSYYRWGNPYYNWGWGWGGGWCRPGGWGGWGWGGWHRPPPPPHPCGPCPGWGGCR